MKSYFQVKKTSWVIKLLWLSIIGLFLAACSLTTEKPKIYKVGLLSGVPFSITILDGFKAEMVNLGYIENETIVYDLHQPNGNAEETEAAIKKFISDKVDLIVLTTTGAALTARSLTEGTNIPVVFTLVSQPEKTGVVDNLAQPGGNITGVNVLTSILVAKRLEYLHQIAPNVKRVWVPYQADYSLSSYTLEKARESASAQGLELIETPINTPEDVATALETQFQTTPLKFDAILRMPDLVMGNPTSWEAIFTFANKHKLPIVAHTNTEVKNGGLFGFTDDLSNFGTQAAFLADKILQGADPGTLQVVSTDPHLIINMKTAQALGLTINDIILAQATEIIR